MVAARYAHAEDFFRLAEEFTGANLVALLGMDKRTIKRWRRLKKRIPWPYFQLLYEHSRYGLAERDSSENFNRQMLMLRSESLERRVAELSEHLTRMTRLIDWECANDPFTLPGDPRANM